MPGTAPVARYSSTASDISASTPSATDTSRYAPSPVAPRRTSAARIATTACMPPPALSATVAPGTRRPAVGAGVGRREEAADREVVEVVPRALRVRTVLAVAARRAVHDRGVHRRDGVVADAERRDDAGPEALDHHVGAAREAQERAASVVGLEVDAGSAASRGARRRSRTAARSARRRASAPDRPSRRSRRSRRASATRAPPDRPTPGRAR